MHLNGTAAVVRHQAGPASPAITREGGALLNLSPAERAAVRAELAAQRLSGCYPTIRPLLLAILTPAILLHGSPLW